MFSTQQSEDLSERCDLSAKPVNKSLKYIPMSQQMRKSADGALTRNSGKQLRSSTDPEEVTEKKKRTRETSGRLSKKEPRVPNISYSKFKSMQGEKRSSSLQTKDEKKSKR